MSSAEVGDNVGILVKNIKKEDVRRGYVLATPGFMKIYKASRLRYIFWQKKKVVDTNLLLLIINLNFFFVPQI